MKIITCSGRWLGGVLLVAALSANAAGDTNRFGFTGPEIFPIDNQVSQLHAADLNGDGLNDLVVVNNARSKINILYNQTGRTNSASPREQGLKREINELPPDARFRIDSIASEKRIASLEAADLNGDGRVDLAYFGDPKELVVLYNQGTNGWSAPKRWPLDDGQLSPNALCAGDLNGDGLADLLLLAESHVYALFQEPGHTLREPAKIPFTGSAKALHVADIDGDGRNDLLLVNWEDRHPFRIRLQKSDGELGPEIFFASAPIRSFWADTLETTNHLQLITIAQNSGRATISEFIRKPGEALSGRFNQGQFQVLPLNRTDRARRGLVWADLNGDSLPDFVAAEPETGEVSLYLQEKDGSMASPKAFSTLAGITDLAAADWDGDGKTELFMLSPDERQVGVTRLDSRQRLPFPTLVPLEGKPVVFAAGILIPGAKPVLAVILDQEGRRSLMLCSADGTSRRQKLGEKFTTNPTTLAIHDADQDGLPDLVLLTPYEKVKVLRQVEGRDFEELDIAPPGGILEQPWLGTADIDGDGKPELLLPQRNFVRAVVLKADSATANATNRTGWTFKVREQINGAAGNSRLAGAVAAPNGSNTVASIFLLDAERKALTLCERDMAGLWAVVRNIPLPVSEFLALEPARIGASRAPAVCLIGLNALGVLPLEGDVWDLKELDSYETPIRDAFLNDVVCGDLDNDGRKDLVFLETARNYLDLVLFSPEQKLVPANRWQVFEERTFRTRRGDLPEPREALVADMTGRQKADLVVLVHDRILLYPQE